MKITLNSAARCIAALLYVRDLASSMMLELSRRHHSCGRAPQKMASLFQTT